MVTRSGSTLVKIMSCLTAPSHYLNLRWFSLSSVRSSDIHFTWGQYRKKHSRYLSLIWVWKIIYDNYSGILSGANELISHRLRYPTASIWSAHQVQQPAAYCNPNLCVIFNWAKLSQESPWQQVMDSLTTLKTAPRRDCRHCLAEPAQEHHEGTSFNMDRIALEKLKFMRKRHVPIDDIQFIDT